MKKLYTTTKGELVISYPSGKTKKRIAFKSEDGRTGKLETDDKDLIKYIESRSDFGTYITVSESSELSDTSIMQNSASFVRVSVSNYQEAREYLIEKGFSAEKINTPAKIEAAAKKIGVEFTGLNG